MATPQNQKSDKKSQTPPPAAKPTETVAAPAEKTEKKVDTALGTPAGERDRKVLVWSQVDPDFRVRVLASQLKQYGAPEHKGKPMLPKPGALSNGAEKAKAKEEEKARIAAMSPEEKAAYQKSKREGREKARADKKAAERAALIEQLKAEIAAGKV